MRIRVAAIVGCVLVAAAMQLPLWRWIVEDAAISFAFAQNLADGHGLVPYPGRERVEAFSNPAWVGLLAIVEALGVDSFTGARVLGLLLGVAVVPAVAAIGRRVQAPILAAIVAGTSASLAIWSASGLENPLLLLLLAAGSARLLTEHERGGLPISALLFAGVALTRPEGIVHGAIAAFVLLVGRKRSLGWLVGWALVFTAPVAAYEAFRLAYFGFPLPSTYYAKLGTLPSRPLAWTMRGWGDVRGWFAETGAWALVPVVLLGVIGRRRAWLAAACTLAIIVVTVIPGPTILAGIGPFPIVEPSGWPELRGAVFALVAAIVALAAIGRPGGPALLLCWLQALFTIAFAVRSQGDWMHGYRFLSPLAVSVSVLIAAGVAELAALLRPSRTDRAWGLRSVGAVGVCLAIWAGSNVVFLARLSPSTSAVGVRNRLDHYRALWSRLHLERPFVAVDHDMGAMVYWHEPRVGRIIDSRGLVDLPFALHHEQRKFVVEYLFEEHTFDLAHAHGSTKRSVGSIPAFTRGYVEGPGYGRIGREHGANYLRRDLFLRPTWDGPARPVTFGAGEDAVTIEGFDVPSPEVAVGSGWFVEIAVRARRSARLVAFLSDGDQVVGAWELPLAYDWVPPEDWRGTERFVGRFALPLADAPEGPYDLGFVVLGRDGAVLPAVAGEGHDVDGPRYAVGEARFADVVQVVSGDALARHADADRRSAYDAAKADRCEEAEARWELAIRHQATNARWATDRRPDMARRIAACWSRRALALDPVDGAELLERARAWDVLAPALQAAGGQIADALEPRAHAARAAGDDELAYTLFRATVLADPGRAWARRYAEEARARRLGLTKGAWAAVEDDPDP